MGPCATVDRHDLPIRLLGHTPAGRGKASAAALFVTNRFISDVINDAAGYSGQQGTAASKLSIHGAAWYTRHCDQQHFDAINAWRTNARSAGLRHRHRREERFLKMRPCRTVL